MGVDRESFRKGGEQRGPQKSTMHSRARSPCGRTWPNVERDDEVIRNMMEIFSEAFGSCLMGAGSMMRRKNRVKNHKNEQWRA